MKTTYTVLEMVREPTRKFRKVRQYKNLRTAINFAKEAEAVGTFYKIADDKAMAKLQTSGKLI